MKEEINTYNGLGGDGAASNANKSGDPSQDNSAITVEDAFVEDHKVPEAEEDHTHTTQPSEAETETQANGQAPMSHEEELFEGTPSLNGSNFVDTTHVRF